MKKLLVLSFFPAFTPPQSGGELRLLNMYGNLSERFDISLISWTYSQARMEVVRHRQTFREYRVPKGRAFDLASESCRRAGITGELSAILCAMVGRQGDTQYHEMVAKLSADADAIVHESPYTVSYDSGIDTDRRPRIYNSHNIESDMIASLGQGNRFQEIMDSVYQLERRLIERSHLIFATSAEELLKFRVLYPAARGKLRLAPNGFDPEDLDPTREEAEGPDAYALFIGSQHPPNIEGGQFLTGSVAPLFPHQRFLLAGRMCQSINAVPPNVTLLGEVSIEQKRTLFRRAQFFVNPIFEGAGTSLKMVEALASGLPVVTTQAGARGLGLGHEVHALIAERDEFGGAVSRMVHDADLRSRLSEAARETAFARFSWSGIGRSVADEIDRALAPPHATSAGKRGQTLIVNDYSVRNAVAGGSKRIFSLMREVAAKRDVTLLCLHDGSTVAVEELLPGLTEVRVPKTLEHRAFETGVNNRNEISINDIAAALHCLDNAVLTRLFRRLCDGAEAIIFSHPYLGPLLELIGGQLPTIYEAHNVESEMKAGILRHHLDGGVLSEFVTRTEDYLRTRVDAIICTTDADRRTFERCTPGLPCFVVLNGCDLPPDTLAKPAIEEHGRRDLTVGFRAVFVGSGHPPNVDAARFLCTRVLPQIPNMELWIVGSVCAALDSFADLPGLRMFSVVSDQEKRELLLRADIALNPVLSGGGSNLKLADYCAHGLPIVSTPDGARGFDVTDKIHLLVRPQSQFVEAIQELVADPARRRDLAEAAHGFASAHLDWAQQGPRYEEVLQTVAGPETFSPEPRMLVVTYRYTEPCLGGAEEYLARTLQRYVALHGTSIDLVAPNVGDVGNRFHFVSDFAISQTEPCELFAPFLREVRLFPPDPVNENLSWDASERLWRMWMSEARLLGRDAIPLLAATCLLGGWYGAEQHGEKFQRWSSESAEIHVARGVSSIRLRGWHDGSSGIDLCVDGEEIARVPVNGEVEFEVALAPEVIHHVRLSMPTHMAAGDDTRHLGFVLRRLEVQESPRNAWRAISLEHGFDALWRQADPAGWIDALRMMAVKRTAADERLFHMVRGPRSSGLVNHVRAVAGQYDIVLVQGVPFSLSVDVAQAVRDAGTPLLVLPHFHVDDAFYHWRQYYELFAKANVVLSFSEWVSGNFFARLAAASHVIPGGGVEPAEYTARAHLTGQFRRFRGTDRPWFLVLGRKTGSKGYHAVVQAHQELLRAGDLDVDLVLVGPDEDSQPVEGRNVFCYGRLSRELTLGALGGCTALISMSTSESFGIVLVEAWMSGRPVIANKRCLAFTELVDDGTDGVLVGGLGELVDAMRLVMVKPDLAATMGEAGQRKVMARYTWSAVARGLHQIVSGVVDQARVKSRHMVREAAPPVPRAVPRAVRKPSRKRSPRSASQSVTLPHSMGPGLTPGPK